MTLTLTSRRTAEDVRVDAFVRAIRRSADCGPACDHVAELALHPFRADDYGFCADCGRVWISAVHHDGVNPEDRTPAQPAILESTGRRVTATLTVVLAVLAFILVSVLIPDPASAATSVMPDPDAPRWVQLLGTFGEQVAATAHAITPR